MKVRSGFVSNSSSTSFCILGWYINWNEENLLKLCRILESNFEYEEDEDLIDVVDNILEKHTIDFSFGNPNSWCDQPDGLIFGKAITNQTKIQDLPAIAEELMMKFKEDIDPTFHIDGWYDG